MNRQQVIVAVAGMTIGLILMLLALRSATPHEFATVGAFLLLAGFCKLMRIHLPKI